MASVITVAMVMAMVMVMSLVMAIGDRRSSWMSWSVDRLRKTRTIDHFENLLKQTMRLFLNFLFT